MWCFVTEDPQLSGLNYLFRWFIFNPETVVKPLDSNVAGAHCWVFAASFSTCVSFFFFFYSSIHPQVIFPGLKWEKRSGSPSDWKGFCLPLGLSGGSTPRSSPAGRDTWKQWHKVTICNGLHLLSVRKEIQC